MVATPPVKLVFYDTFKHETEIEHVDSITFKYPIKISEVRVVPHNIAPWKKLNFIGLVFYLFIFTYCV